MKTNTLSKIALVAALGVFVAGCANQQQTNTAIGAGGGAALGAGLGALLGNSKGAAIGAGLGAVAGGLVGYNWKTVKQDVEKSGSKDLGIDMTEQNDGSLKVNVPSSVSFDTGSYALKPALLPVLDSVAKTLNEHPELRAKAVGHTDNTGQMSLNQTLSQNRAQAVANYLANKGVSSARLTTEGRGPNDPIASNDTVEGRAANRRTEIYLYATKN
ncbi:OmpA family protein [Pigmentiphaga sp. H8]|uniref:OmpA family protein n=1 Tax=unclassified Pigmentiphaga TaxID=2626614 RepID=UPI000F590A38|nr:OmpA family protein [Pigmentiphaga sp. H8]AZG07784.1 OmpA family protein [Pigmentiphaga sp. H8]